MNLSRDNRSALFMSTYHRANVKASSNAINNALFHFLKAIPATMDPIIIFEIPIRFKLVNKFTCNLEFTHFTPVFFWTEPLFSIFVLTVHFWPFLLSSSLQCRTLSTTTL